MTLVPVDYNATFDLAERICKSPLLPDAYRNKPVDAAVAMIFGAEIGLPPMTALNRVVVISGKPTLDAQGMSALIRQAGHSLTGEVSDTSATAIGRRKDTGDEMKVSFSLEDAKRAGLIRNGGPWTKFPGSMCWARAVSQLARELFSDVLMGFSYVPEEMQAVVDDTKPDTTISGLLDPPEEPLPAPAIEATASTVRQPPAALQVPEREVIESTGEIIEPAPVPPDADEQMAVIAQLVRETPNSIKLKGELIAKFGPASSIPPERLQEVIDWVAGWSDVVDQPAVLDDAPF